MTGDRLGNWTLFRELGRGGMGRVYLAQEELTGRRGAIKVLAAELAQDAGFLQRFQREIETLSKLNHPGIVRFFESGHENGLYFYAMEYVDGQSLDDLLLAEGKLPWKEVLDIAIQICPALRHVHDHGIIHRDLKPPNIMRTPQGEIKLMDFGIAKVFASTHLTATGGVVGTAEFLSPEQAAGKPATKRSDLYSLGVVLYTLLTGRPPFEGNSFLDLLHKHRYAQFDRVARRVPEIPYEIDDVVCQLLEKEPDKRPPDCHVLGKHLESIRRKLERKNQQTAAGQAATVAENQAEVELAREGPATMMSRLMRQELERQAAGGPVSRLFNSPWVVAPLLLLCIGLIVWAFWPLDMEALYSRGAALMKSGRPSDMEEAWRDYFEPLNRRFPEHPYKEDVDKYKGMLDAARATAPTEAQRFYQQGERLAQVGQLVEAKRVWQNLIEAFHDVEREKDWVRRAERALAELDKAAEAKERWHSVRASLDRAAALRDQGKRAQAERIWSALEALYRNDPLGKDVLDEISAARKK